MNAFNFLEVDPDTHVMWVVLAVGEPPRFMLARVQAIDWDRAAGRCVVVKKLLETPGKPVGRGDLDRAVTELMGDQ